MPSAALSPAQRGVYGPLGLTLPGPDGVALASILERYRRVLARRLFVLPSTGRARAAPLFRALLDLLRALPDPARRRALDAVLSPEVQAPLNAAHAEREQARTSPHFAACLAELTAQLAFRLARDGAGAGWVLDWPGAPPPLIALDDGLLLRFDSRAARVRFRPGRLTWTRAGRDEDFELAALAAGAPAPDAPAGLRIAPGSLPLAGATRFALYDNNPLAALEYHPEKAGNALDLGGRPAAEWTAALAAARALVGAALPELQAEMDRHLRLLVPVGFDAERHDSASVKEAVGVAYLTLHPRPMTMAEALIHEFQHNTLNALLHLVPLFLNDPDERYASPVRPDPRPVLGIALAVHAFLPVAEAYFRLWRAAHPAARERWFLPRWRQITLANRAGLAVLQRHARPTDAGRLLLEELALHEQFLAASARAAGIGYDG